MVVGLGGEKTEGRAADRKRLSRPKGNATTNEKEIELPKNSRADPSIQAPGLARGSYSGFRPTCVLEGATGLPVGLHKTVG